MELWEGSDRSTREGCGRQAARLAKSGLSERMSPQTMSFLDAGAVSLFSISPGLHPVSGTQKALDQRGGMHDMRVKG